MSEGAKPRRKSGLISLILGKINMLLAAITVSLIFSIILEWVELRFGGRKKDTCIAKR